MSIPIFPITGFSVLNFTPVWNTIVSDPMSGKTVTASQWDEPKYLITAARENITSSEMHELLYFFNARKGRGEFFYWHFKDLDFSELNGNIEAIGIGDAVNTIFNLSKYPVVPNSAKIYVNNVLQEITTDYSLNEETGVITFEAGSIPADGHAVAAEYGFYLRGMFNQDSFEDQIEKVAFDVWSLGFEFMTVF